MTTESQRVERIRQTIPPGGLFLEQEWQIAPHPFQLTPEIRREFETLGRVLLQFYRALNLLYQHSAAGKQPAWIADWLDRGKPADLIALQRSHAFKNQVPRVIRPDVILTEDGLKIVELDSVPGGIGLTAWLNQTYAGLPDTSVVGGTDGMLKGFAGIFDDAQNVHIVISEESKTYRPEMEWLAQQLGSDRFAVRDTSFKQFGDGDAVYRFFELFDLPNVTNGQLILELAREGRVHLTAPPKPILEEKMMFALLWNRNLYGFWRQNLGESFFRRLLDLVPYSWLVDPTPLPPQAAIPRLELTDWNQLKSLSQRERELILKVSGFSSEAWGARGVYLGNDLSQAEWSAAVDKALSSAPGSPYVLQRFHKPKLIESGRVRLCPYYFVHGAADSARAHLGGVLATICPPDKKIIHGMKDAVLAPCA
ncbi:MAG TPA: hypothetical protein VFC26_02590 [Verrucomicrobiae bacterium]|nr:hypothetical protein [Verrucomicrobiae bacterium]